MIRARRRRARSSAELDVVVVGGGMAGLTASAFAARSGARVLLLEQRDVLGGLVQSYTRDGFTWDAGIRALEDSGIILPMLSALGIELPFVRSPVSIGIEDRIIPVESRENLADYQALLEHFFPQNHADIRKIVDDVKRVMKHMGVLYDVENPAFKDLPRDRDYLLHELLPWLGKFLLTIGKINRMNAPIEQHLAQFSDSRALIDVISQHFFQQTPAFFAMSYFSLYLDYMYPVGGTGQLPQALEAYGRSHGVTVRMGTRVDAVDPVDHRVLTDAGDTVTYRKLIWAADVKSFYRMAKLHSLPPGKLRRAAMRRATLVSTSQGGDSVFTLNLAIDRPPEWFAERSHGHFFYTPSRVAGSGSIRGELRELLANTATLSDTEFRSRAENWIRRYVAGNTYEISIPVLKDETLAPPGKTGLIVSLLFDYTLCEEAARRGWYEELKMLVSECLIDALEGTVYPDLRSAVLNAFSTSPLSIARAVGSSEGAITGWAFSNEPLPAIHRMQKVARSVQTPLPDIYQAGQWAYSPSGVPIAILTGKLAADQATKRL